MAIYINGSTMATSASPYGNGTAITKIYANGTLVWEKAAANVWSSCWSGEVIIAASEEDLANFVNGGDGSYTQSQNMTANTNITGKSLQLVGTLVEYMFDLNTGQPTQELDSVSQSTPTASTTTGSASMTSNYNNTISVSGSGTSLTATSEGRLSWYGGQAVVVPLATLTAVYYKQ